MSDLSDTALLQRITARDGDALAELYDRYANIAYSLAMRMVGEPAGARSVVLEALQLVWEQASAFDPDQCTAATWLVSHVHTAGIAAVQRRRARVRGDEVPALPVHEEVNLDRQQDLEAVTAHERQVAARRSQVREAWQSLTRTERRTVELAYFQGYSVEEIARLTGETQSEVLAQMEQSLAGLREIVERRQGV